LTSRRLYYDDCYTTRFEARIAAVRSAGDAAAVELEATFFYPESGGQEADRGRLGSAAVVDVQADEDGRVWHTLAPGAATPPGEIEAEIDWVRRFDHMQQHTGQHILSAALERLLSAPTLSSHLGDERGTIEVGLADAGWDTVARVEEVANRVVWEDRPVERHWTDAAGAARFKLRKPPAVTDRIRIVEIPEWDVSACGGTHVRRTGEVGLVKIVRWDKVRGNVRFEFLCGRRALLDHAWRLETLLEAARRRTIQERDLIAHLERAAAERDALRTRLADLLTRSIAAEARIRVGQPPQGVADLSRERTRDENRTFALKCLEAGAPWVVAATAGPEPSIVVARAKVGRGDLKSLLPELLARGRGKGGGAPDFLQIACADAAAVEDAFAHAGATVPAAAGAA
jgi:alanyl-tRNA synthetase